MVIHQANPVLGGFENFQSGTLFEGDCLEALTVLGEQGVTVDLIVTSPPYGKERTYEGFSFDFPKTVDLLCPLLKLGGVLVWIVNDTVNGPKQGGTCDPFRQVLYFVDQCSLQLHDTMIWKKSGFHKPTPPAAHRYAKQFEYMFILSNGHPLTFNPIEDRKNKLLRNGVAHRRGIGKIQPNGSKKYKDYVSKTLGKRTNVWEVCGGDRGTGTKKGRDHPAVFPFSLASDHIRSWSNPGDIVLDPFMGSGTTAHAADQLDRFWIGSEVSSKYCEIIRKRILRSQVRLGGYEVTTSNIETRKQLGLS